MSKKVLGAKGKPSSPITSWGRTEKVRRSAEGLWGASKYSHDPEVFVANILRPAAGAIAAEFPRGSTQRTRLFDYADTNFSRDRSALEVIRSSSKTLRKTVLDIDALEQMQKKPDTPEGFCAWALLHLVEGKSSYVAPNSALILREPEAQLRGDSALIENNIKYLAHMALGEVAIIPIQTQTIRASKDAA